MPVNQIESGVTQVPREGGGSTVVSVHTGDRLARTEGDIAKRIQWLTQAASDESIPLAPGYIAGKMVRHALSDEEREFIKKVEGITGRAINLPGVEENPLVRVAREMLRDHQERENQRSIAENSLAEYLRHQRRLGPLRFVIRAFGGVRNLFRPEGAELFNDFD